jgi:polyferredoxin
LHQLISNPPAPVSEPQPFDLMRVAGLGRFLGWRHARTLLQVPLLVVGLVMIVHGLVGPSLSPKNLATVLTWVHFRGALVLVLLAAGNFFCLACPFMLVRNVARRFIRPRFTWPRALRNKWLSVALFALILFVYELFDLWASPWLTAWLILAYFLAVLVVDGLFKHATFCKFVCPLGQFNFAASLLSPLEVAVRDQQVCTGCMTKDCIRGRREPGANLVVIQRGCELALFQPRKVGNMDCTFCLDCVHACPHSNVGIVARSPGNELTVDPTRSGIGLFSKRKDLTALVIVFSFGALLNAFGMVSPVYAIERWIGSLLHVNHEAPVLATLFMLFLVVEPVVLLGLAAWVTRKWGKSARPIVPTAVRYSYALVPLGFGMWLAHYGFHFFTGLLTIVAVTQNAVASLGWPILGTPLWTLTGVPLRFVRALEMMFLGLGLAGSLMLTYRLAERDAPGRSWRIFIPWAAISILVSMAALWLLYQPMEMRATLLGG